MPKYAYKATDQDGNIQQGVMETANLDELEMRLDRLGMMLISQKSVSDSKNKMFKRKGISRKDLIIFCFNMEQMSRSGVQVSKGLIGLRDGLDKPKLRELVAALVEDIDAGKQLSEAMRAHPHVFSTVFTQLIQMGERTGQLDEIFLDLTENLKWEDELIAQAKKVMTYPLIVGSVVTGLVFFLMIYLVPQLMEFIKEMGGELPLHTRALIATSDFVVEWWYLILATPVGLFVAIKIGVRTSLNFQRMIDGYKLKIWLFGPLLRKIILVRFARAFSLMYKSGISVLEGIQVSEGLVDNVVVREALEQARTMVSDGKGISESFQATAIFPPLVLLMMQVGESTGNLDKSMLNISYFYDRDVKETIGKIESLIEPIMTGVLGAVLGWVIMSVLGPIYDIIQTI